uniref:Uncharacterized protein n=1 Tax=Anguilla anguilla TaxID=7936 RepID=A0A0E9QV21_ANGAN
MKRTGLRVRGVDLRFGEFVAEALG